MNFSKKEMKIMHAVDESFATVYNTIIVSKHNLYAEKADLSKKSYSDIESC